MLYFAYGSNMNNSEMQRRCPGTTPVGASHLIGYRLVFDFHADIIPAQDGIVHGALWEITVDDEETLDRYESYPSYYNKYYEDDVMFYRMKSRPRNPRVAPSLEYLKSVIQGYRDFGLTQAEFEESLGVQQLGLASETLEEQLGVSIDALADLFSDPATAPTRDS